MAMRFRRACRTSGFAAATTAHLNTIAVASSNAISVSGTAIQQLLFRCHRGNSAPLYVEMMGGAPENHGPWSGELHDEGQYLLASEILNKLVLAEPENQTPRTFGGRFRAARIPAGVSGLRNSFLAAAYELGRDSARRNREFK